MQNKISTHVIKTTQYILDKKFSDLQRRPGLDMNSIVTTYDIIT